MNNLNRTYVSQSISKVQSTVLVIESNDKIFGFLNSFVKDKNLFDSLKVNKGSLKNSIKSHDMFVINIEDYNNLTNINKFIKNIYKSNNKSTVFLVGNYSCKKENETKEDSFIFEKNIIKCDSFEELTKKITEHIYYLESTKKKLSEMWLKLVRE